MDLLPHRMIYNPRVASFGGHNGITVYFWTWTNKREVGPRFVRHEKRHVLHWVAGTVVGALVIGVLAWFTALPWWCLVLSPLGFILPYFLSFIPGGYKGSWFERDADRYADRLT